MSRTCTHRPSPRPSDHPRQALQAQGMTLAQLAAQRTTEGLRTKHGRPWHKPTVASVLKTHGR
jgi:hypothetical protein